MERQRIVKFLLDEETGVVVSDYNLSTRLSQSTSVTHTRTHTHTYTHTHTKKKKKKKRINQVSQFCSHFEQKTSFFCSIYTNTGIKINTSYRIFATPAENYVIAALLAFVTRDFKLRFCTICDDAI